MSIEDCEYAPPRRDLDWLANEAGITEPIAAIAEVAGVSPAVIAGAIDRGELPAVRIGSRRRVPRDAAIAYLQPLIDLRRSTAGTESARA